MHLQSIARQLLGPDTQLDFDQILAKAPNSGATSTMAWHQDSAYCEKRGWGTAGGGGIGGYEL
jgi:hypothetical protein